MGEAVSGVTASAATAVAATKAIQLVVEDVYSTAKGEVREKIARWRTTRKLGSLARRLTSVRKVKTIWETEREIDLFRFYYPAKVILAGGRTTVRSFKDLGSHHHILLE